MSEHIALLGDSIFDNASYTDGMPDVVTHLRHLLPGGCSATLLAVDGSTTSDLAQQLAALPQDVTRAVVSVGGNDALLNADILNLPVTSTQEALHLFAQRVAKFDEDYRAAVRSVVQRVANVTLCTIYNGDLPADQAASARVALMIFNDTLLRIAFELQLSVIDLRPICVDPSDYVNAIEPSGQGGEKIARAIAAALGYSAETARRSQVFAG